MAKNAAIFFSMLLIMGFSLYEHYKDGKYSGISKAGYLDEPYYGCTQLVIENGKISRVEFFVRDSAKHEYFDDHYEKYFIGNEEYMQQCRNDRKGVLSYPDSLLKYQDINKLDAIAGATWSYNLFKASVKEALMKAEDAK
jgi:major membrane immunogen (membrane-anchored lipoprotein)